MKMHGLCDICGAESSSLKTCPLCGRMVCPRCFDASRGACRLCTHGRTMR